MTDTPDPGAAAESGLREAAADRIIFTHTEVDSAFEHRGVASRLIGDALDDPAARRRLGAAARSWAERLPDFSAVGAAYDALYRSLGAT